MTNDIEKMTAEEFARWWSIGVPGSNPGLAEALARRDAYREREALKAAAERARDEFGKGMILDRILYAIFGKPRFVKGQLVMRRGLRQIFPWPGDNAGCHETPEVYEPVLDRDGKPVFLPVEEA